MKRKGSAVWRGGLKDGKGTVSTDSGVLSNTQYSFSTRFEDGKGTNPEELIAAAHAGCFSMALSAQLGTPASRPSRFRRRRRSHSTRQTEDSRSRRFIWTCGEDTRRRQAGVRHGGEQRQVRLPRVESVECHDHDGRYARGVRRVAGSCWVARWPGSALAPSHLAPAT